MALAWGYAMAQHRLAVVLCLSFSFNADFQKINSEIPFTPFYLEL